MFEGSVLGMKFPTTLNHLVVERNIQENNIMFYSFYNILVRRHWLENRYPINYFIEITCFLFLFFATSGLLLVAYSSFSSPAMADSNSYKFTNKFKQFKKDHNKLEIIKINSYNPVIAAHILNDRYLTAPVKIDGVLFMPLKTTNVPVVMFIMSSDGPSGFTALTKVNFWRALVDQLTKNGVGVLFIDSFTARGVSNTYADQSKLSFDAMVMDALMAFKQLLSDQRVDPEKIAIAGHSRGGIISFAAPDRRYTDKILGKDRHFAASIPMAAACYAMLFENPKPSKYTKYYIFHGLADNYSNRGKRSGGQAAARWRMRSGRGRMGGAPGMSSRLPR